MTQQENGNEQAEGLDMRSDVVSVLLAEYQSLRTESDHYAQRIDRITGVYITVMFAIAGFMLRPDSDFDLGLYLEKLESSVGLSSILVFVSILNSLLLIRSTSFFLGLLAICQYIHYRIRPAVSTLVAAKCMEWDEDPKFDAKSRWIPLRTLSQGLFIFVAESLSVCILILSWRVATAGFFPFLLYIGAWFFFSLSMYSLTEVSRAGARFHRSNLSANP